MLLSLAGGGRSSSLAGSAQLKICPRAAERAGSPLPALRTRDFRGEVSLQLHNASTVAHWSTTMTPPMITHRITRAVRGAFTFVYISLKPAGRLIYTPRILGSAGVSRFQPRGLVDARHGSNPRDEFFFNRSRYKNGGLEVRGNRAAAIPAFACRSQEAPAWIFFL